MQPEKSWKVFKWGENITLGSPLRGLMGQNNVKIWGKNVNLRFIHFLSSLFY